MRRTIALVTTTLLALAATVAVGPGRATAVEEVPIDVLCAGLPASTPFADITGDTFEPHVRCLHGHGLTSGVGPATFAPGQHVTREQLATFVVHLVDRAAATRPGLRPLPPYDGSNRFVDVAGTHLVNINRLAAAGIVRGGPGGLPTDRFAPGGVVTREQVATFVVGALDHLLDLGRIATVDHFGDDGGSVHEGNINALASFGITVGAGGSYHGGRPLTRGQMAAFLVRSLAWLHHETGEPPTTTTSTSTSTTSTTTSTSTTTTSTTVPEEPVRWQDIDTVVTAYRTFSGLDCGLRPGDEPTWGVDDEGRLIGGTYMAELEGTAVADPRPTATFRMDGWVGTPWFGNYAHFDPVPIDILGIDLYQVDYDTDVLGWPRFPGKVLRETRVPLGERPEGWITCDYYGWWFDEERLAISEEDYSEHGNRSAFWHGTVDVFIDGGIPALPELPPVEVPELQAASFTGMTQEERIRHVVTAAER